MWESVSVRWAIIKQDSFSVTHKGVTSPVAHKSFSKQETKIDFDISLYRYRPLVQSPFLFLYLFLFLCLTPILKHQIWYSILFLLSFCAPLFTIQQKYRHFNVWQNPITPPRVSAPCPCPSHFFFLYVNDRNPAVAPEDDNREYECFPSFFKSKHMQRHVSHYHIIAEAEKQEC